MMRILWLLPALVLGCANPAAAASPPPIQTDHPCHWSKKPDGTLVCKGHVKMDLGAGSPTIRECGMTFYAPIRFTGVKMSISSSQPTAAPFEIHDTIPFNYAPNASTVRWVWAAAQPSSRDIICNFEFDVVLPAK